MYSEHARAELFFQQVRQAFPELGDELRGLHKLGGYPLIWRRLAEILDVSPSTICHPQLAWRALQNNTLRLQVYIHARLK